MCLLNRHDSFCSFIHFITFGLLNAIKMDIGTSIKKVRKRLKMTQDQLAGKVGLSPTAISHIENGKSEPTKKNLASIANALGVPLPFLYFLSVERSDVREDKKPAYDALFTPLHDAVLALFKPDTNNPLPPR